MRANYITVPRQIFFDWFRTPRQEATGATKSAAISPPPVIVHDEHGKRKCMVESYGCAS